jgi:hypothetical protein
MRRLVRQKIILSTWQPFKVAAIINNMRHRVP